VWTNLAKHFNSRVELLGQTLQSTSLLGSKRLDSGNASLLPEHCSWLTVVVELSGSGWQAALYICRNLILQGKRRFSRSGTCVSDVQEGGSGQRDAMYLVYRSPARDDAPGETNLTESL
jgi:hypothetical protein